MEELKKTSQGDILVYKTVIKLAKQPNRNIQDILKGMSPEKQEAYKRGRDIFYKKESLKTAKEKTFKKAKAKAKAEIKSKTKSEARPKTNPQDDLMVYNEVIEIAKQQNKGIHEVLESMASEKQEAFKRGKSELIKIKESQNSAKDKNCKKTAPSPEERMKKYEEALRLLANGKKITDLPEDLKEEYQNVDREMSDIRNKPDPEKEKYLYTRALEFLANDKPHEPPSRTNPIPWYGYITAPFTWKNYEFMDGNEGIDDLPSTLKYAYAKLNSKMLENLKKGDPAAEKYLLGISEDLIKKGYNFKSFHPILKKVYLNNHPEELQKMKPKERPQEYQKNVDDSKKIQLTEKDYQLYAKARKLLEKGIDYKKLPVELQEAYKKVSRYDPAYIENYIRPVTGVNPKKKWTVLIYADGVNNLGSFINYDIEYLKQVGTVDGVNIIIRHGGINDTELFENKILDKLSHKMWFSGWKVNDYVLTNPKTDGKKHNLWQRYFDKGKMNHWEYIPGGAIAEDLDMGSEKTLTEFLVRGIKQYPADHYFIIIQDHGGGHKGISIDEKSGNIINLNKLKGALSKTVVANQGRAIDGIFFNACLMNQAEVAGQIKHYVNCQIGSEAIAMGYGVTPVLPLATFPQTKYIHKLNKYDDIFKFSKDVVNNRNWDLRSRASFKTISALNLRKMKFLESDLKTFSGHVDKLDFEKDKRAVWAIRQALSYTHKYFPVHGQVDLYDFMDYISKDEYLKKNYFALVKDAENIKKRIKEEIVIAEKHKWFGLNSTNDILTAPDIKTLEKMYPDKGDLLQKYGWLIYQPYVPGILATSEEGSHGISINLPTSYDHNLDPYHGAYESEDEPVLEFLQNTGWERVIKKISKFKFDFRELDEK